MIGSCTDSRGGKRHERSPKLSIWLLIPLIIVVLLVVLVVAAIAVYNNLVKLRNRVDNAWAQMEVQLQRRNDLIPNLMETVKGYAGHESKTLQAVTQARAAVMGATTPNQKVEAEGVLTGALKGLLAVAEAYPELKANGNFQQLQAQLADTEDKISYMRQSYNDCVMTYNTAIQTFPGMLLSGAFQPRESFSAAEGADVAPKVSF